MMVLPHSYSLKADTHSKPCWLLVAHHGKTSFAAFTITPSLPGSELIPKINVKWNKSILHSLLLEILGYTFQKINSSKTFFMVLLLSLAGTPTVGPVSAEWTVEAQQTG